MIFFWPQPPKPKTPPVVITTWDAVSRINKWLTEQGHPELNPSLVVHFDKNCNLYTLEDANKVRSWIRNIMYDKAPGESSDCDNTAEHYSYWFHRILPGCAVLSVSGRADTGPTFHRFVIIVCSDGIFATEGSSAFMRSFHGPIFI